MSKKAQIVPNENGSWRFVLPDGTIMGYGNYRQMQAQAQRHGYKFPENETVHLVALMTDKERQGYLDAHKDRVMPEIPLSPAAQVLKAKRDAERSK